MENHERYHLEALLLGDRGGKGRRRADITQGVFIKGNIKSRAEKPKKSMLDHSIVADHTPCQPAVYQLEVETLLGT